MTTAADIQEILRDLGHDVAVDGKLGPKSLEAIRKELAHLRYGRAQVAILRLAREKLL